MSKYIIRRILQVIPVMLIVTAIVFFLVNVAGDPTVYLLPLDATEAERETMREALGLNRPIIIQYLDFLKNAVTGNFGNSIRSNEDAMAMALSRLPISVKLAGMSLLIAVVISIPLGILSAQFTNSPFDLIISGISVLGRAMPSFWVGIMLIMLFAVNLRWFPVSGSGTTAHMILPATTLAIQSVAAIVPLIRSNMLSIIHDDYIRTARSKGVSEFIVICVHAFKNALVPVVTIVALQIPSLIGGSLITETVFAWPGIGQLLIQSIKNQDMNVVQACIFMIALITLIANLIADLVYCLIDPRIKYE